MEVSVVVATHNRAHLLPRLIAALDKQKGPSFEVVVVDDASTDETWSELQRLASDHGWLRPVQLAQNSGPATARNVGWRNATAPLLAFTDDDCVPQPGWLAALAAGLREADIVQGRTEPDPETRDRMGPFSRTLVVEREDGYYQTCNMGYRRGVLERLGGFDQRFKRPSGEDTDLAWRGREAGCSTKFVPDAVVHHDVRPSSYAVHLRDTARWGDCVLTLREHPQLRSLIHRKYFFRQSHPPAIAGAIGLALLFAPRARLNTRATGALLLYPYWRLRTREWPLRGGPRRRMAAIPAALLADIYEVGVITAAAVRYRTFIL